MPSSWFRGSVKTFSCNTELNNSKQNTTPSVLHFDLVFMIQFSFFLSKLWLKPPPFQVVSHFTSVQVYMVSLFYSWVIELCPYTRPGDSSCPAVHGGIQTKSRSGLCWCPPCYGTAHATLAAVLHYLQEGDYFCSERLPTYIVMLRKPFPLFFSCYKARVEQLWNQKEQRKISLSSSAGKRVK